jgi:hypothetical protein
MYHKENEVIFKITLMTKTRSPNPSKELRRVDQHNGFIFPLVNEDMQGKYVMKSGNLPVGECSRSWRKRNRVVPQAQHPET